MTIPPGKTADKFSRLVELSVALNSTLDLPDLLQMIISTAQEILDCEAASILLYDENQPHLFFAAAAGSDPKKLAEVPVPIEGSLAGLIFRTNRAMTFNQVDQDPRHFPLVGEHVNFHPRSLLGVPMRNKDRITGVLEALNKQSGDFDQQDEYLLSVIAAHAAVAINNAQLLQSLQNAYDLIQDANRLKRNFLELAARELRSPLGVIIGYATYLKEDTQGENAEYAQQVLTTALQMRTLIEDMSNLTLLENDGLVFKPQPVSLQKILEAASGEVQKLIEAKSQQLVLSLPYKPLMVNVDLDKTTAAFTNLLNNAIRFSPPGGTITIGASKDDRGVLAWVQDDGHGISPDQIDKVFLEYYQARTPDTRRYGGIGLGLSTAKGLFEAQGGRIWAESEGYGKGAVFKVQLPGAETSE